MREGFGRPTSSIWNDSVYVWVQFCIFTVGVTFLFRIMSRKPSKKHAPPELATWMTDSPTALLHLPLNQITLLGSHNSGTYDIRGKTTSGDCDAKLAPYIKRIPGVALFVRQWAKCQRLTVAHQLEAGIRYLDVRVQVSPDGTSMRLCHSICGIDLDDFLDQVKGFLDAHPLELVVLDVNHIYVSEETHHAHVLTRIIDRLGGTARIAPTAMPPSTSLHAFRAANVQVAVLYHHDPTALSHNVWPSHHITSPWPNVPTKAEVFAAAKTNLADRLNQLATETHQLHVLQLVPTARGGDLIKHFSVLGFSKPVLKDAPAWLVAETSTALHGCNVVLVDDCGFNQHAMAAAVAAINARKAATASTASIHVDVPGQ
ncbi:Aste57867_14726 [Aphanomyces stellatus]|uniref:Aste57867_12428 protein n=1 Tax=Aphanomyces stellatus TaxID=120398 RepID=A0A485L1F5_9STRA|nr:hypothetical protein As57867_014671 [Aphanomyces stellatus]KAF0696827.1 hypothetical protein As57867_012382 [Aphanomyces stellatus]KAF0714119.1 hypothetical protein As57867_004023 [Aphanomyces stellatus]VFT81169.1 Aste57867_4034 [Aphanomyces stellatus]VFT89279.1 Aste57867_12428 [Aphanomyces stellatus]